MYDIAVVGGGAAGMLASAVAAELGASVLVIERNAKPGKKLLITGKGRCNLTNNCSVAEALCNIPTGGRFLQSAFNAFSPDNAIELFEKLGVPLKTERGHSVFPKSDSSGDVVDALCRYMDKGGVKLRQGRALGLFSECGRITGAKATFGDIKCCAVILATGGLSYPATGSSGDGYGFAEALGHTVKPLRASLVPLEAEPAVCGRMQGLTLKNVRLSVYDGSSKPIFSEIGEIMFTHFGLSGPLVLSASAHMRDYEKKRYYAHVDLKPALDERKFDERILRDFKKFTNRDFGNSLVDLLPRLIIPVIVERSGISPDLKVHSVSREQRMRLANEIKRFKIDITGSRPIEEAVITSGGVDLREIDPKTMESKLVSGLYFAGEIIDADAYTGGFNLQIAWSTAYAAARAAVNQVISKKI